MTIVLNSLHPRLQELYTDDCLRLEVVSQQKPTLTESNLCVSCYHREAML